MLDNVRANANKAISVMVAVLLAALLVPVVPQAPTASAAQSMQGGATDFIITETNDQGVVTKGIFNNHNDAQGGKATFEQVLDQNAIDAAIAKDAATLPQPTVETGDSVLQQAAQTAAKEALAAAAQKAAEDEALKDLQGKVSGWQNQADTDAATAAKSEFAKDEAKAALEVAKAQAAKELLELNPDAKLGEVTIKKNPDATLAVQVKLGDAEWAAKSVSSTGDADSIAAAADTTNVAWKFGSLALADGAVASSNEEVTKDAGAFTGGRTLEIAGAGTSTMKVPYTYNWIVEGAPYSFTFDYGYSYTPHYSYPSCSYTYGYDYAYTYQDADGNEVGGTGTGEVKDASIGNRPSADLSEESGTVSNAQASGDFACDYDPQAGKEALSSAYEYTIEVVNLFSDAAVESRTHEFSGEATAGEPGAFTYYDKPVAIDAFSEKDFPDKGAALAFLGEPLIGTTDGFVVTYDQVAGTLEVAPKKATAPEGESVDVTWTLPDGATVTHTVHAVVNPFELAYEAIEQPFRLKESQEQHVLEAANENVRKAILAATGDEIDADYYAEAVLADAYDGQGAAAQDVSVTFVANDAAASAYGNYAVVDAASVAVKKMEAPAWSETGLTLVATNGQDAVTIDSGNASTQWINSIPSAAWYGYRLAYATQGVPADEELFSSSTLSGGDGTHDVELYAMDADGVVCEVTGITYLLDTQIPVLSGAQASAPQKSATFGGVLFGDTYVNVDFSVIDEAKQNKDESKDPLKEVKASGVDSGKTKAWYTDVENGQSDIPAELRGEAPLYSFTIQGDKDVPTNSIKVQAVDAAGNVLDTTADQSRDIPIEYTRLVADSNAPEISIAWDTVNAQNGRYYPTNRNMTITIEEAFFNYVVDYSNDQVVTTVSENGQAVIAVHPSDFTEVRNNVWQYSLAFTTDADWEVTAPTITDIVGRTASATGDSFTIDKTNPTMDVAFDNNNARNGNYYNASRTATITVTEHNFSGDLVNIQPTVGAGNGDSAGSPSIGGWSSSGDVHTATVTFPGEGVYSMTVDGMDLATNALSSYSCPEFIVDTIQPQIELGGLENMQACPADAQPQVSVHDTNLDSSTTAEVSKISYPLAPNDANPYAVQPSVSTTDLTVQYPNPESVFENDGVYTLRVEAVDMAGNTSSEARTWSVNRFGSTYVVSESTGKILNEYLQASSMRDVEVTEINPSGLKDDMTAVELTKDTSNKTLSLNEHYRLTADDSTGWSAYTYTVLKSNFNADGAYRVLFHSEDKASNMSENTMDNKDKNRSGAAAVAFAVDNTAPLCGFIDLDNSKPYEDTQHRASVSIEDNLKLKSAEIRVNGEKVRELDEKELAGASVHDFELSESADEQQVEVVAYDAAGNRSEPLVMTGILVNSDPIVLWMHNTPLMVGSIVGGIAIVGLAAAGITWAVRKRKAGGPSGKAA